MTKRLHTGHGFVRKSGKVLCTLFIMLFISFSCKKEIRMETEPNNTFSNATPVSCDQPVSGYISTDNDVDYYRLDITSPAILDIQLSAIKGVNHALRIWQDADAPVPVKLIDDTRKSSLERFINLRVNPGIWYIAVQHGERDIPKANPDTPYSLLISSRTPLLEESEPNDTPAHATQLSPGETITGYFSPGTNRTNEAGEVPAREEDWYQLTIPAADDGTLRAIDVFLNPVAGINCILYLYNDNGILIGMSDNGEPGQGESIESMGVRNGTLLHIMVCSKNYTASTEPYILKTDLHPWSPDMELEPNNSRESATVMSGNTMKGSINGSGDCDWFRIPAVAGARALRLEVIPGHELDLRLDLFDSSGISRGTVNNGREGITEVIPIVRTESDLIISVSTRDAKTSGGTYTINLNRIDQTDGADFEIENNDTRKSAMKIAPGKIIGLVNHAADKDYYLLEFRERKTIKACLKTPDSGKLRFSVTDPQGYVLRSVEGSNGAEIVIKELIEKRGYLIIESLKDDFEHTYLMDIE